MGCISSKLPLRRHGNSKESNVRRMIPKPKFKPGASEYKLVVCVLCATSQCTGSPASHSTVGRNSETSGLVGRDRTPAVVAVFWQRPRELLRRAASYK